MKLALGFDFLNFSCPVFGFFDFREMRPASGSNDAIYVPQSQPERFRSSAERRPITKTAPSPSARLIPKALQPRVK